LRAIPYVLGRLVEVQLDIVPLQTYNAMSTLNFVGQDLETCAFPGAVDPE